MNTETKYLGLHLKNPIVVGSCGLTADVDKMVQMEQAGAGAVVVKSVFEEQIIHDIKRNTHMVAPTDSYGDSYEYIAQHVADDSMERHFSMIREAKRRLTIPVIGSITQHGHPALRDLPLGRRRGTYLQPGHHDPPQVDFHPYQYQGGYLLHRHGQTDAAAQLDGHSGCHHVQQER